MDFGSVETRLCGLGLSGGRAKFALEGTVLLCTSFHYSCRKQGLEGAP